jgi:metal-responsive CopG/Arc/MetJ family transcriptional regulator
VRLLKRVLEYIDKEAERESVDRSVIIRRLVERGAAEFEKEKAAKRALRRPKTLE